MKKFVLTVAILAVSAAPAFAQIGAPAVYADAAGNDCNITPGAQFTTFSAYIVHKSVTGATGSSFKLTTPSGNGFIYQASVPAAGLLTIGAIETGISVAYGGCITGDLLVFTINYFATAAPGAVPPCQYVVLEADPSALQGTPLVVDCDYLEYSVVPGKGIIASDASCTCNIPVQESTWGKVKSLYR
ncbi:MAG TPA: hypothetical protein VFX92_13915 [Candidatus Krumholzibacteria bacterium]|nr:hypothetical protein [Candidatus Krumholzibacteria bacterium]